METEPIDVKKLLKRVVNSTGSLIAVSFSIIRVGESDWDLSERIFTDIL